MNKESINTDLDKALSELPPEIRAKLNTFKTKLMQITYKTGISEKEFKLKTKRLEEDFKIDIQNGFKDNK
jgi:5'(3')-deoxyribonucleotidase